jgi:hypothetical protein
MQCTCIALTYLCLSTDSHSQAGDQNETHQIDRILSDGSDIYNSHISTQFAGKPRYLMADELPSTVTIRGINYKTEICNRYSGILSMKESVSDSLTFSVDDALSETFQLSSTCLLTIGTGSGQAGYTTAVVKHDDTRLTCFDSHARNAEGLRCPNGKAVVMEANSVTDFASYLRKLARSIYGSTSKPFEVVTVRIQRIDTANLDSRSLPEASSSSSTSTSPKLKLTTKLPTEIDEYDSASVFFTVNSTGRRLVRCRICFKFPHVAQLFSKKKGQLPAVCTDVGTVPRKDLLEAHLASEVHTECLKMDMLEQVKEYTGAQKPKQNVVKHMFNTKQMQLAGKMGRCFYTVYNDAKRATLSAWSWPSREVAHLLGCNAEKSLSSGSRIDNVLEIQNSTLQYLIPQTHADLLDCIVKAHKETLKQKVLDSLAISIRADGSVDRTQIDNVHVMANIVTADGLCENVFLGFAEPKSRGAAGYCSAIIEATSFTVSWDDLFPKITSIVTDGASINVGERSGLWTRLQKLRDNSVDTAVRSVPLLKIWCTVHRSSLAWKDVCSNVTELKTLLLDLTGIASYFRQSGIRTRELFETAKTEGFRVFSMPKYFEVRWTEFTHALCHAVIASWRALVTYLKCSEDKDAAGFFTKWTEYSRLQLLSLVTDITFLFASFQKTMQSDSIHISDVRSEVDSIIDKLHRMETAPLIGGWEERLNAEVTFSDNTSDVDVPKTARLHDIELTMKTRRRTEHHKFVSDRRGFDVIRAEILQSLITFLHDRLDMPELACIKILETFSCATTDAELRQCHALLCPDKPLRLFANAYRSAASVFGRSSTASLTESGNMLSSLQILLKIPSAEYDVLRLSLARAIACKPHSADVERLISFYNLLKTSDR